MTLVAAPNEEPPRLSEEIGRLQSALEERPLRLGEMIEVMQGRAYTLLLIILCIPFCSPIPIPALSTVVGIMIALIGLRLSLGLEPKLPARLLATQFSRPILGRVLGGARRLVLLLEKVLRPRLGVLIDWVLLHHLYGLVICLCGLLLTLPLPIPFTNFFPAATIILLAAALIARDGYFIIAGLSTFALTCGFFTAIFLGGAAMIEWLEAWAHGLFDPAE